MLSPHVALIATSTACLRDELAWLRTRQDDGAIAPCIHPSSSNSKLNSPARTRRADRSA
jgi:hypothetical protein